MKPPAFRDEVNEALADGWKIEEDGDERVVLKRTTVGSVWMHLLIAVLTAWWTLGAVNVVYAAVKYFNDSKRKVLYADDVVTAESVSALRRQYARGEIGDEEFDRRTRVLRERD